MVGGICPAFRGRWVWMRWRWRRKNVELAEVGVSCGMMVGAGEGVHVAYLRIGWTGSEA